VKNVGELRAELRRIAAAIQVERAMIATTQESFKDDAARMRYIWRNSSREDQVKSGWIRLSGAEHNVEKAMHYCDVVTRQLDEYEQSL
jgi:hypothetical protein